MKIEYVKILSFGFLLWSICGLLVAQPRIEIMATTDRTRIYETYSISWTLNSDYTNAEIEYRYKLDVPGDWFGGISYAIKKWSDWIGGLGGNSVYSDFVIEGNYKFSVEYRLKSTRTKIASSNKSFDVYWEYPEIQEEAFNIDWNKVSTAKNQKEKYTILSEEYYQSYLMWYNKFEYQYNLLKLTKPINELIEETGKNLVEEGYQKLLEKAAPSSAKIVGKILLPLTIYEIISSGVTDLILIYRNSQANKAFSMMLISKMASEYFEKLAQKENESDIEKITLGFILDSSGSMKENDPRDMRKSAMKVIIDQLQGNENIFIVDFDNNASWINPYNWQNVDKQDLKSTINRINSDGGTNVGAGLEELRRALESSNVSGRTGVLLLSDGLGDYSNQAEWYRQRNIPVYTISFIGEDNSKLLNDIASLTSGNYLKANSGNEIITAFNQFLNYLRGDAILTVYKSNILQGEQLTSSFFTESNLQNLFVTLVWRGSTIDLKLHSPDGKIFSSQSSGSEWKAGDNYIFVKIDNPAVGKWTADLFGTQIPAGGEDFNFQVSGDSPLKIDLSEKKMIGNQMQFSLQSSGKGNISNIKPKIEVTTPKDRKEDISNSFSNNTFSYRSRDGQGNYNFEISLTGKDDGGSTIQRYFARTIFVGEGTPSNIAPVKMMEGNYIYADLGEDIGNFAGLECTVYSQNGNSAIANGYVTFVNETECTIEIQSFLSDQIVNVGDLVELNVAQWQQDF